MTSPGEGLESASIFRAEALRAGCEPPPPVELAARWPAAAGGAVALCVALLATVPALCWLHYAPEQAATGRWNRSGVGAMAAQFQVPRHPRGTIRVGDAVDIVTCRDGAATTRGRVVAIQDMEGEPQGSGQLLIEVSLPQTVDETAHACTLTARFRPARASWRELIVRARVRAHVGRDGEGG